MITDLAKMTTGLMMKAGLGLPLRIAMFVAMSWGAWWFAPLAFEWAVEIDKGGIPLPFALLVPFGLPFIGALIVLMSNTDCYEPWGLVDFLRRAPFICWCLITEDGQYVPVWAILLWPVIVPVDFVLAVGTLIVVPCWGIWVAAKAIAMVAVSVAKVVCRAVWFVLSYTPLDKGGKR